MYTTVLTRTLATCFAFAFCVSLGMGAELYPYTAHITQNEASVYSSPDGNGYVTQKLPAGDAVEVYQENPNGWCAIRPPVGSFSWISGAYVDVGVDHIGTIATEVLSSRVGSEFSDICKTIQVQLPKGEKVYLLGRVDTPENAASPFWYKIAPPSGEFRWVHKSALSVTSRTAQGNQGTRLIPSRRPIVQVAFEEETPPQEPLPNPQRMSRRTTNDRTIVNPGIAPQGTPQGGLQGGTSSSASVANQQEPRVAYRNSVGASRQPEPVITDPYQRDYQRLNREAHIVMNRPVDDWAFETLLQNVQKLVDNAPTEYDRTRAIQLYRTLDQARTIRKTNAIQREYVSNFSGGKMTQSVLRSKNTPPTNTANTARTANPVAPPQPAASYTPTSPQVGQPPVANSPYKAQGRLGWFSQRPEGYPPFALVNEQGQIVSFVTPQSGFDLTPFIDKQVGINGTAGIYISDKQRVRHIEATAAYELR